MNRPKEPLRRRRVSVLLVNHSQLRVVFIHRLRRRWPRPLSAAVAAAASSPPTPLSPSPPLPHSSASPPRQQRRGSRVQASCESGRYVPITDRTTPSAMNRMGEYQHTPSFLTLRGCNEPAGKLFQPYASYSLLPHFFTPIR